MSALTCVPYCFTMKSAVDASFLNYVVTVIRDRQHLFQANQAGGARRFLTITNTIKGSDEVLFDVKQRLADYYNLGEYVMPPNLKDFIGYITKGGYIHPHTDPDLPGKSHVRVNVLITQTAGCIPLIEGIPILVSVGDAWLNLASRCSHATTPVTGSGHRSALSFGYQIDPKRGDELYDVHRAWRARMSSRQVEHGAPVGSAG